MAKPSESNVGARLRSIRDQQGLSLRALSKRCGLSINAISLIERGENSPTVATLHRLATALNIQITDFFINKDEKQTVAFIKRDMGLRYQKNGTVMQNLGIGLYNQQIEPFLMKIAPGKGSFKDPISHAGEEFVYCLEGEIEYLIGDRIFQLEQGDSLLFDATENHAYRNRNGTPSSILLIFNAAEDLQQTQRFHIK